MAENVEIKNNLEKTRSEKDQHIEDLLVLTHTNASGNAEIKKLNDIITEMNRIISRLESDLKISNDRINKLHKEIEDLNSRINEIRTKLIRKRKKY